MFAETLTQHTALRKHTQEGPERFPERLFALIVRRTSMSSKRSVIYNSNCEPLRANQE